MRQLDKEFRKVFLIMDRGAPTHLSAMTEYPEGNSEIASTTFRWAPVLRRDRGGVASGKAYPAGVGILQGLPIPASGAGAL